MTAGPDTPVQATTEAATVSTPADDSAEIVAKPSWWPYRLKWVLMGLVLLGYGAWSIQDGFFKYPAANAEAVRKGLTELPHPGLDVPFNQVIGIVLPPLGLLVIAWALYNSRGQYRLAADGVLHAPGHPPVPLDAITTIDKSKWDRKGIAYLAYELPGGGGGRVKLDDYIYERKPTDDILERIERYLVPEGEDTAPAAASTDEASLQS